ncbi:MAG: terminase [Dehalococcoidia bacterium]|nr:terminase [Dehalococcoidia bacterium]
MTTAKSAMLDRREETAKIWQMTRVFRDNLAAYQAGKRRALNEGGTSSSKTISILQLLIMIAKAARQPLLISVVSESMPHQKKGCLRDFKNILGEAYDEKAHNKTENVYTFPSGGAIEFFGADESGKVHGPRRDILFINEANNVPWDTARALDIRTRLFTLCDWNPVSEFWAHERWKGQPENAYIHSTYQDAIWVLPPEVVVNIESNRNDANWWNIYGLGKLGKIEGLVYPHFEQVDELPEGDRFIGLDFGFANDPAAVVSNVIRGDCLYSQELVYELGLTNNDLSSRMEAAGLRKRYDEIFADSAEPKSIEELYRLGWNIKPCPKGADSVEFGHQKIRQYKQFWTKDSVNAIKEQRNFRYIADKNGKLTEKTTHLWSHSLDGRRYAIVGKLSPEPELDVLVYDSMSLIRGMNI